MYKSKILQYKKSYLKGDLIVSYFYDYSIRIVVGETLSRTSFCVLFLYNLYVNIISRLTSSLYWYSFTIMKSQIWWKRSTEGSGTTKKEEETQGAFSLSLSTKDRVVLWPRGGSLSHSPTLDLSLKTSDT